MKSRIICYRVILYAMVTLYGSGCMHFQQNEYMNKIAFELSALDVEGLRGPANGKVAVSYEFVIPDTPEHRREVSLIDPTVQFMPGSRGRIGATDKECLCIGSTHQENYRMTLLRLAELPYIDRIIECHFE